MPVFLDPQLVLGNPLLGIISPHSTTMEVGHAALPSIMMNSELFYWFLCEHSAEQTTANGDQSSLKKWRKEKMNK